MLSLHTNAANLRIQSTMAQTQKNASNSALRLGTGLRINSAADDPSGLRMATRLQAQSDGMKVAMSNSQNAKSLLQTADGSFDEIRNMLLRMKDLATQSADGSYTDEQRADNQAEFNGLGTQIKSIIDTTTYGGQKLFGTGAKFAAALSFQIGATASETMSFDISKGIEAMTKAFDDVSESYKTPATTGTEISTQAGANTLLTALSTALESVSTVRGELGANINRLDHVHKNLSNMRENTNEGLGRIMDVDYAAESANHAKLSILQQAGTSMLKQTSQMNQMILSLLQ